MSKQPLSTAPCRRVAFYLNRAANPELSENSDLGPLQTYAAQAGYQPVATYRDDGKDGELGDRAALSRLLDDARQGRFDVLLVAHRSRIAHTPAEAQPIIENLRNSGVAVESLADDISPSQSQGAPARPAATAPPDARIGHADLRVGMDVLGANGSRIGTVKQVGAVDIWVDRTLQRDVYVPFTAIQAVTENSVVLHVLSGHIGDMGWDRPTLTGQEQPEPTSGAPTGY